MKEKEIETHEIELISKNKLCQISIGKVPL